MGAKFDAVTKGEYADIQGESFVGFSLVPGFQKAPKKLRDVPPSVSTLS